MFLLIECLVLIKIQIKFDILNINKYKEDE